MSIYNFSLTGESVCCCSPGCKCCEEAGGGWARPVGDEDGLEEWVVVGEVVIIALRSLFICC